MKKKESSLFGSTGPDLNKPKPWNPEPWRLRGVQYLLEHAAAGLLLDPGMGKTSMTLAAIKVLLKEKLISRALIIVPLRPMYLVWPAEIEKWLDFNGLSYSILHDKDKEKNLHKKADIYFINPDGLRWLFSENRYKIIKPDLLVVDELSKFKHIHTQRFKLLKKFLGLFRRRWGLTGSPNPKGYLDLFGQAFVLDMGNALGPYITHYRNNYFFPVDPNGWDWKLKPGADKIIQDKLKPLMLRMDAEDYVKLPKEVQDIIWVELPPDARKLYDDMEDEMLLQLWDGEVIVAASAAVSSLRCCQIANGGIYRGIKAYGEKRTWEHIHDKKTEALVDLIEELQGTPLLIAYEFQHDLDRIRKHFGKDFPYIGGGVSTKRSIELERMWNAGELEYLGGHPASIGHGVNLQFAGNHVCHYNITWDFELYDQFNRRVRRSGNKHSVVFVHHIAARNTIDMAKLGRLKTKNNTQKGFLDAMNTYRKEVQSRRQLPVISKARLKYLEPINDADEIPF
jgi:SNF2 family DNA or RNA helicase